MNRKLLLVALGIVTTTVAAQDMQRADSSIVISHVTVIDGIGSTAKLDQTVVIQGNRIAKIASTGSGSAGQSGLLVDGSGLYLIPGLWDMHVHIWDADLAFPLFLANGVTGVRNTGGRLDDLKQWRRELSEGKRLGPQLIASGPVIDGPPPIHPDHSVVVKDAAETSAAVQDLKSQGWDFIKVYDNVPRDAYFALADEAKKEKIPFAGHVPLSVTALEASAAGQKSIEHLDGLTYVISPKGDQFRLERLERIGKPSQPGEMMKLPMRIASEINQLADTYDEGRGANLFAHLARNSTWQVPTLSVTRVFASVGESAMYGDDRLKYVGAQERKAWEHNPIVHIDIPEYVAARKRALQQALHITRVAHQSGVPFLAGTDSGGVPYLYYGFSLHSELALLVEAGFTPMEALEAATRDAARFLGIKDSGTIEIGRRADLVLLTADPLKDIHNTEKINAVIVGGRLLDRKELNGLLNGVASKTK